ncbi:MAG TPA: translocation/assembly module TamB domain-containing protein [Salinimicrobium sp.]|nr:translocation/assembly module TamB domain-containing protein [Salinimicrobium sp.]
MKVFAKILFGIIIFLLLVILFVRSPWGQNIIKDKFIASITNETGTVIEVDRIFLTFSGNLFVDGLYIEDEKGDTLIYSQELEADIPLLPLIKGHGLSVNSVDWNGVRANIIRKDTIEGFNFQFLIDAMMPADTTNVVQKDTIQSQQFRLGEISLSDFDVVYNDAVLGIESSYDVSQLDLEMREMDLDSMKFSAFEGKVSNSVVNFKQVPFVPDPNAEEVPLPTFSVEFLELENVAVNFESVPAGMIAEMDFEDLKIELPKADFQHNVFDVNSLVLNNSEVLIKTKTLNDAEVSSKEKLVENQSFWPDLWLELDEIELHQNKFVFINNGTEINRNVFDPNAIEIEEIELIAENVFFKDEKLGANVHEFTFVETGGIYLNELHFKTNVNDQNLKLEDLVLHLNANYIEGNLAASYSSIQNFIENPENARIDANLDFFDVSLEDLFVFQPHLRNNDILRTLSRRNITGRLNAEGSIAALQIPVANANWGRTSIVASGMLRNPMDIDRLTFNFPNLKIATNRNDINLFVPTDSLGINFPERLVLNASVKGNLKNITADADLKTSEGQILIDGNFQNENMLAFNANLQTIDLELGNILQNQKLGKLNVTVSASGEGENVNHLDATLDANINSLQLNQYEIKDWHIDGEIENGSGFVNSDYKDDNINVEMESYVVLDSVAPKINMDLDMIGVNLQRLGFTNRDIRAAFDFDASFKGNLNSFDMNAEIIDGVAVYAQETYLLGDFGLSTRVRPDSTAMDIRNQVIDLHLRSNTDPASFANALQEHYKNLLEENVSTDTILNPINLQLRAEIRQQPILDEVFMTGLNNMDTLKIAVDFDQKKRELLADIKLPLIDYRGIVLDSLSLDLKSQRDNFNMVFDFQEINYGALAIKQTALNGSIENGALNLDLISVHQDSTLLRIQSEIRKNNGDLFFHINPSEVIFRNEKWQIPESNQIVFTGEAANFTDFRLSNQNEFLEIVNNDSGGKDQISINFGNFNLANILNYLNPDKSIGSGNLKGQLNIVDPYGSTGFIANVDINNLELMQVPIGNLMLDTDYLGGQNYDFDLAIKEGNVDLDLNGRFYATEEGPMWDTELQLNKVEMIVVEGFSLGALSETSGSFSGDFTLAGTFTEPVYQGNLHFNNAAFTVNMLNAPFVLPDENLKFDTEKIYFEDFDLQDENNSSLTINGEVTTQDYLNPGFDLTFDTTNFTLLHSTEEDNELYYGTAIVDANGSLTGDLNLPKINMDLNIDSESKFTYVIPPAEIAVESREGVIIFVNKENPDNILTQTTEESYIMRGFGLNADISAEEGSTINIIINEETGDNLQIIGEGDLVFDIYPNGRTTLSGRYVMSGGHYEINLYSLVNRRFEIVEGSSINWSGDPYDAQLDVQATYEVETSASSLMASRISGADPSIQDSFRQEMEFLVFLNVDGTLTSPVLSFGLGMDENERGSLGGQVYGRIQQLNEQEQEMNKQVFSLLVLNRFYPAAGTDGSGGGTVAVARDNLNDALSDQLNLLSNDLLNNSGFTVDFGIDSFTDYQGSTPQERTQLDIAAQKTFMDERLVVRVGSEVDIQGRDVVQDENTPIIGNVSIAYLITEDGRFRIRGFRKNTFENVIDGQIIINGIALLFTKEFNKFRELWASFRRTEEVPVETTKTEN